MVVTSRESRNDVEMSAAATDAALALSLSLCGTHTHTRDHDILREQNQKKHKQRIHRSRFNVLVQQKTSGGDGRCNDVVGGAAAVSSAASSAAVGAAVCAGVAFGSPLLFGFLPLQL